MQITPLNSAGAAGSTFPISGSSSAASSTSGASFGKLMSQMLQDADQSQQQVTRDMNKLLTGEVDNIHDVAINVAQADVAFRLVMEVRDKLIAAYQDVMRMQV